MIPAELMGPPVSPVPVPTEVTVPLVVVEMVTAPVAPDTEIPEPAVIPVTPVFVRVMLPVEAEDESPAPVVILVTPPPPPAALIVEVA
jgi:hypothetical protein